MAEHVYKIIDLVGTSPTSIEDAVQCALSKAGATVQNMRWFQIVEVRGSIDATTIAQWQVTLKIGFTIND